MLDFNDIKYYYTIPSDNWEQQQKTISTLDGKYYTIPSDNWEQQQLLPSLE